MCEPSGREAKSEGSVNLALNVQDEALRYKQNKYLREHFLRVNDILLGYM